MSKHDHHQPSRTITKVRKWGEGGNKRNRMRIEELQRIQEAGTIETRRANLTQTEA